MAYLLLIFLIVRILIMLLPGAAQRMKRVYKHFRQKFKRYKREDIFYGSYLEVKAFYVQEFNEPPCITYIGNVNDTQAFEYIRKVFDGKIQAIYQQNTYNWQQQKQEFSTTVFRLENNMLVELSGGDVQVLYNHKDYDHANKLVEALSLYKSPEKEQDFEINVITQTSSGLCLKQLEIKPTVLDIDLYYNDDFKEVDVVIKDRLTKHNDKGIILLHGIPGTGKTTYLRHLIGHMKKRVLFVSPAVAGNLMNPEFLDLLIDYPNSGLVIEDAENIIMDRRQSSSNSVSNLLNISDGLLSDCLNVQIICTFNSALHLVDNALMRKGRLIAKYEFGKLDIEKARRLSSELGLKQHISEPMTLADITNSSDKDYNPVKSTPIGFRRTEELLEN